MPWLMPTHSCVSVGIVIGLMVFIIPQKVDTIIITENNLI